ncbi:TPM domain-containing protein [Ideonella paludis]|uniref:TPM domain-containing protein n=1 Tax=Ideonella paludis TaxID=1233411 RepID=A0ABS5DRN7_9BURK|nr:TPM domain-containing protein [Ideonella paludis]MBQ0933800.1 TPM domain-containing protein [Ideonella paludis]
MTSLAWRSAWKGGRLWPLLALALALFAVLQGRARAQDLQPIPALSARVMDQTGTLSDAQRQALEAKLARFETESGPQLVILMVASSQPEDLAAFAYRVADHWKIGRKGVGDGVLIVVAKDDRRMRIEVAKDLEGAVPDLAARQIIDQALRPAFKAGDYAGGLNQGVDQLMARIRGEHLPAPAARGGKAKQAKWGWQEVAMLLFIGVPVAGSVLSSILGRKLGVLATGVGTGALAGLITTSLFLGVVAGVLALIFVGVLGVGGGRRGGGPVIWGGGGGGGGWGGGGGFSSGGGGEFGGGGASGDW